MRVLTLGAVVLVAVVVCPVELLAEHVTFGVTFNVTSAAAPRKPGRSQPPPFSHRFRTANVLRDHFTVDDSHPSLVGEQRSGSVSNRTVELGGLAFDYTRPFRGTPHYAPIERALARLDGPGIVGAAWRGFDAANGTIADLRGRMFRFGDDAFVHLTHCNLSRYIGRGRTTVRALHASTGVGELLSISPAVPEPSTLVLLGIGLGAAAGYRWRRRSRPEHTRG